MSLVNTTLGIYVGINALGLLWTAAIIHFGVPENMRIQKRGHKWDTLWQRLPLVFLNQAILMTLVYFSLTFFGHIFSENSPIWYLFVIQLLIVVLFDDLIFYTWHRFMHEHKSLYNRVHRIHHKAFAPLPIEYIYVHPLEWLVGSLGPFLGLVIVYLGWGSISCWLLWTYLLVRNLHELDVHSGIRSPIGKLIPLYAEAEHHDLHHAKPTKGNYASTLTFWDRVLGTYYRP